MKTVLHLIQAVTLGGAARALFAVAKYSSRSGEFRHLAAGLTQAVPLPDEIRTYSHIEILKPESRAELHAAISAADIVHLHWWNNPDMADFLAQPLPPCRLVIWAHVGGHQAPQIITRELVDFADALIACSPYTNECPAFRSLPAAPRLKTGMIYGAADFERLAGIRPAPHENFNVGYIGTVDFLKMHPHYVQMSARVSVPNVRFVVCGDGGAAHVIRDQAARLGIGERLDVRGYVSDIRAVLATFDVYGYPLCEETYAASEINLQEAMYAGVPPVVFPYGGVKKLVMDNFTGFLVQSEKQYAEAIEYLFHRPDERSRIGRNAHEYAAQIFSAEIAARQFNELYSKLLQHPKRERAWAGGSRPERDAGIGVRDLLWPHHQPNGTELFIESLGAAAEDFLTSYLSEDLGSVLSAERRISRMGELMKTGGVKPFADYHPSMPHLSLWSGLLELRGGFPRQAIAYFTQAFNAGLKHWRTLAYLAEAAAAAGENELAQTIRNELRVHVPREAEIDACRVG